MKVMNNLVKKPDIFIWVDHGQFEVYDISQPSVLNNLLFKVHEIALQQVCSSELEELIDETCELVSKDLIGKILAINKMLDIVGDDCESFEYGTGFSNLIKG